MFHFARENKAISNSLLYLALLRKGPLLGGFLDVVKMRKEKYVPETGRVEPSPIVQCTPPSCVTSVSESVDFSVF